MATHSSVLAWRIPGMGEPGGLPSMGSHRVRHDWSDLAAVAASTENAALYCSNLAVEGSSSLTSFIKVASSVITRALPPGGHFELGACYKNAVFMSEIHCVVGKNVCECVCVPLLIFHCISLLATCGLFWSRPYILSILLSSSPRFLK